MATTMRGFAAVVASLEPEHWVLPTPCPGWSVFDVVDHVVAGERFTALTLAGASLADATATQAGVDVENPDVVSQVTDAAAAVLAAFDGPLDRMIAHRVGAVSARRVLGFRIIDQLGHTWDIAAATGQPGVLDPRALAVGIDVARAERATLERSPNFATVADDGRAAGDPLTTFLRSIGRTPSISDAGPGIG